MQPSTIVIVLIVVLGIGGFAVSLYFEKRYRERMRKEQEEIRTMRKY